MADRYLTERARELRRQSTDAERVLWSRLRARGLLGVKFRRQATVKGYIADFVSTKHRLIVELDGGHHADQQKHDELRTRRLESQGYRVLRFWDNDALRDPESVLEAIRLHLDGSDS